MKGFFKARLMGSFANVNPFNFQGLLKQMKDFLSEIHEDSPPRLTKVYQNK
jgi:hypothetical protein